VYRRLAGARRAGIPDPSRQSLQPTLAVRTQLPSPVGLPLPRHPFAQTEPILDMAGRWPCVAYPFHELLEPGIALLPLAFVGIPCPRGSTSRGIPCPPHHALETALAFQIQLPFPVGPSLTGDPAPEPEPVLLVINWHPSVALPFHESHQACEVLLPAFV
jgi:hypothetical protein